MLPSIASIIGLDNANDSEWGNISEFEEPTLDDPGADFGMKLLADNLFGDNKLDDKKMRIRTRGQKIIDTYISVLHTKPFNQLLGNYKSRYVKAIINIIKIRTNEIEDEFRTDYFNKIDEMKKKLKTKFQDDLKKICQKKFSSILKDYPVVIRQMYLDIKDEKEKNNFKTYLCKNDFMKDFQNGMINDCRGVSGDINGPNGLTVKRKLYDHPYYANVFYRIKKDKKSGFIIELPRRYNFIYDPTIDPSHKDFVSALNSSMQKSFDQQKQQFFKITKEWDRTTINFINESGKNNIPKVTLKIIDSNEGEEPINVSTCFTSSRMPSWYKSDKVKWSGDVLKNGITPGRYRCGLVRQLSQTRWVVTDEQNIPNWHDAGNYTMKMADEVRLHENGHMLFLKDSYNATSLPANLVGEVGDIMGDSSNGIKLCPRDIKRMIFPALNCID